VNITSLNKYSNYWCELVARIVILQQDIAILLKLLVEVTFVYFLFKASAW